jgi:hypothetical protein
MHNKRWRLTLLLIKKIKIKIKQNKNWRLASKGWRWPLLHWNLEVGLPFGDHQHRRWRGCGFSLPPPPKRRHRWNSILLPTSTMVDIHSRRGKRGCNSPCKGWVKLHPTPTGGEDPSDEGVAAWGPTSNRFK